MRWKVAMLVVCLFAAAQAIRPVSPDPKPQPLVRIGGATPEVMGILNRSCRDCHSLGTEWPWYARIAPVSWMVEDDVKKGRRFLNFSKWDSYSKGQKMAYLAAMASATSHDRMPPKRYILVHPEAELSAVDRKILKDWSRSEFRRVKSPPQTQSRSAGGPYSAAERLT
jgi:hypothetical protein